MQRKNIFIILPKGVKEDYYKYQFVEMMRFISQEYKNQIKFEQKKDTMKLAVKNKFEFPEKSLEFLIEFCERVTKLFANKIVIEKEQSN